MGKTTSIYGCTKFHLCCYNSIGWEELGLTKSFLKKAPCSGYEPDENGSIVDYYNGEEAWNNMWNRSKYVGELLRTPDVPGEYTLEIYFNGQRVKTDKDVSFTVTES